jgi:hypothetical protein
MADVVELADTSDLRRRTEALPTAERAIVQQYAERANAYVWGFQDGAEEPMNSTEAWNFMAAYWGYILPFYEETATSHRSLPGAFKVWREKGEIPKD